MTYKGFLKTRKQIDTDSWNRSQVFNNYPRELVHHCMCSLRVSATVVYSGTRENLIEYGMTPAPFKINWTSTVPRLNAFGSGNMQERAGALSRIAWIELDTVSSLARPSG